MQRKAISVTRFTLLILLTFFAVVSCSVISYEVKKESEPVVPLATLAKQEKEYQGKTVILGGYILKARHRAGGTIIEAAQVPLASGDEPGPRSHSEGKLIVQHEGALDLGIYTMNRRITVAGKLVGCTGGDVVTCTIDGQEIYVWPERPDETSPPQYGLSADNTWDSPFPANWYSR